MWAWWVALIIGICVKACLLTSFLLSVNFADGALEAEILIPNYLTSINLLKVFEGAI